MTRIVTRTEVCINVEPMKSLRMEVMLARVLWGQNLMFKPQIIKAADI